MTTPVPVQYTAEEHASAAYYQQHMGAIVSVLLDLATSRDLRAAVVQARTILHGLGVDYDID